MRHRAPALAIALCVLLAVLRAHALRWTCDDAFISFRYADNLASGNGLVFNVAERVEGYTNFAWTLGIAAALRLGIAPETWTRVLGGGAFAATVLLLAVLHRKLARQPLVVPFAALAYACQPDAAIHATSGLETSAFALFVVVAYAAIVWPVARDRPALRGALAGLALGIATLTRPDGIVFGAAAVLWLAGGPRTRPIAWTCAGVLGAIVALHVLWRLGYYGDVLPNTYYAKSGGEAWWSQGATYLWLYLERYPPLAIAPLAVLWLGARRSATFAPAILALALAGAHALWVVRVGGDFMFARFLVPATPLFLLAIDLALAELAAERPRSAHAVAAVFVAAIAFLPSPLRGAELESGVLDEHAFYTAVDADGLTGPERIDRRAEKVRLILEGTNAHVAFYGAEARFVYHAHVPVALESEGGLTSRALAHLPLSARGRPGHEKRASAELLLASHADLAFSPMARRISELDAYIPYMEIRLDGVRAQLLRWDPRSVAVFRARGVFIPDFPAALDEAAARLDTLSQGEIQREYDRVRHFYFQFADDPLREQRYTSRLAR